MEFRMDEIDGDVMVLVADGGLNADTAEQFVRSIERLVDTGLTKLIIDCTRLTHVSSYGLGILLRLHKRMKSRGGEVKVCGLHGLVVQVLEATHLNTVFAIEPDVNRARLAFRAPASD